MQPSSCKVKSAPGHTKKLIRAESNLDVGLGALWTLANERGRHRFLDLDFAARSALGLPVTDAGKSHLVDPVDLLIEVHLGARLGQVVLLLSVASVLSPTPAEARRTFLHCRHVVFPQSSRRQTNSRSAGLSMM